MLILITGGSASGKSEYAENKAAELCTGRKFYIAAMFPFDAESRKRIARHQEMRKEKNFHTVDCYTGLKNLELPLRSTALLECMSNLTANEMYMEAGAKENAVEEIVQGIRHLQHQCDNLFVVSNEVFSDGIVYEEETQRYLHCLGEINRRIAALADTVVEVVCGLPVVWKGAL